MASFRGLHLNELARQLSPDQKEHHPRNLIPHFIQEEYQKENYEGKFEALTLFVRCIRVYANDPEIDGKRS